MTRPFIQSSLRLAFLLLSAVVLSTGAAQTAPGGMNGVVGETLVSISNNTGSY